MGMPAPMASAVAHGKLTLNDAIERMARRSDVERADLVIVWGVPILPTGRVIYNAARALLIELEDVSLTEMVAQVVSRLRA